MAFCPNCGMNLPPGTKFCPRCGTKAPTNIPPLEEPIRQRTAGSAGTGSYGGSSSYGSGTPTSIPTYSSGTPTSIPTYSSGITSPGPYDSGSVSGPMTMAQAETKFSMGWFKFMIYFAMFAGILLCIASIGNLMNAYGTEENKKLVYQVFPGMETADMILIGGMIATALLILIARFKLAGFKTDAVGWFIFAYLVDIASVAVYIILVRTALDKAISMGTISEGDFASQYTNIAVAIVMLFINVRYLNNRKSLFIN